MVGGTKTPGWSLNANCYITKPVDLDQYMTVVKTIENFWLGIVVPPKTEEWESRET
jgi:two-component system, chemotaxis family, response regulator Rcp1